VRSSSPSGDSYGSPGSVRVVELVDDLPKESTKSACFANRLRILLAAPAQLKILVGVGMTVDNYFGWVSSGSKSSPSIRVAGSRVSANCTCTMAAGKAVSLHRCEGQGRR
jgi:hypothetical protein